MRTRARRPAAAAVATALCLTVAPMWGRADSALHDRIYLLASASDHLYWSVDPTDPEADLPVFATSCGARKAADWIVDRKKPCAEAVDVSGAHTYSLISTPATLFDEPVTWTPANPLRFHFEIEVSTPLPYEVTLTLQKGASLVRSTPATETAPGVWEGTLGSGSPLRNGDPDLFAVSVTTDDPSVTVEIRTRGASWIDLRQPARARSVPDLLRQSPAARVPGTLRTSSHVFHFDDDEWETRAFEGDLRSAKALSFDITRPARFVYAWVEAFTTPALHDLQRGRDVDARKVTDSAILELTAGTLTREAGSLLRGGAEVSIADVPAGAVTARVVPNGSQTQDTAFRAYVLVVYGGRTLRSYEASFSMDFVTANAPESKSCPYDVLALPVTEEVTTFAVRLTWDHATPQRASWTLGYWIPNVGQVPCGELGAGPDVRITMPLGSHEFWTAVVPGNTTFVSVADTVITRRVDFAYAPLL